MQRLKVSRICGVVRARIYFIQVKVGVFTIIRHLSTGIRHAGEPSYIFTVVMLHGVTVVVVAPHGVVVAVITLHVVLQSWSLCCVVL